MNCRVSMYIFIIIFPSFIIVPFSIKAQEAYLPSDLVLTVYADGIVRVDYSITIDVNYPKVEIHLLGTLYEDLVVNDENGIPLDYITLQNGIALYSLGASSASITYFTSDLTSKSTRFWALALNSPVNSTIILPEEATIISLNRVPITIGNLNGESLLIMPKGEQEIIYIIGLVGTREHAAILINEAEAKIHEIKARDIIVVEAEAKLREAKDALSLNEYTKAEQMAKIAKDLATKTEDIAIEALNHIRKGESSVEKARQEGRTTGLDKAQDVLQSAKDKYNSGDYNVALELALHAKNWADKATAPLPQVENLYVLILVPAIVAIVISLLVVKFKKKSKIEKKIDAEKIFKHHPLIRYDDRKIIQHLTEKGGEATETEIREKFRLPRTTAWRMVKRLQKEGIIDVHRVGGQKLLKIKPERYES